ncbi:MAG: sugar transferase [Aeriscardovia sp.]|nr:sugar transferase [Aeriscardovia sp.]
MASESAPATRASSSSAETPATSSTTAAAEQNGYFVGDYLPRHIAGGEDPHRHLNSAKAPAWHVGYEIWLVITDILVMACSCFLAFLCLHRSLLMMESARSKLHPGLFTLIMCLSWIVSLAACGAYRRHIEDNGYRLYDRLLEAMFAELFLTCVIFFAFRINVPRWTFVVSLCFATCLEAIDRWLWRLLIRRRFRSGQWGYSVAVVGSPEGICSTLQELHRLPVLGYRPMSLVPVCQARGDSSQGADQPKIVSASHDSLLDQQENGLSILRYNSRLPQLLCDQGVQTVLIADVLERGSREANAFALGVEAFGMEFDMRAGVGDLGSQVLHVRNVETKFPVLSVTSRQSIISSAVKRVADIVFSAVAIILTLPVTIPTALAIKAEDGGPIFYKQERIGIYGRKFVIYKFRSMSVNADKQDTELAKKLGTEHGVLFKPKDDPRVTRIGKFIRKYSIDEIPQFLNVFLGTMSLVGPRPQQQYEVDQYTNVYSTRLLVKPGLTGPWQVSGRSDLSAAQGERLDVDYVENWSFITDAAIILKTIGVVLRGNGAY